MRLSDEVHDAIVATVADCTTVADITALSQALVNRYPELRPDLDEVVEILVAEATARGLAVRVEGEHPRK